MDVGYKSQLFTQIPAPTPQPGEVLLDVVAYMAIKPNHAGSMLYSEGLKGLQKILNYAAVYRWADVARKVMSRRTSEQVRNDKWLVFGVGKCPDQSYSLFVHPFAQHYQTQIAIPMAWTRPCPWTETGDGPLWSQAEMDVVQLPLVEQLTNQLSRRGGECEPIADSLLEGVAEQVQRQRPRLRPAARHFDLKSNRRKQNFGVKPGSLRAVVFGFGNYVRTATLPYLRSHVSPAKIHEIDPSLLIGLRDVRLSTNPYADDEDDQYPVWLLAGFHHTHAGLALEAMRRGCIPVIEKPIATTLDDFHAVQRTLSSPGQKLYQCFQKRYQIFNQFSFADLGVKKGEPIHYKAIVFEVPLHPNHWYNWPVSGSRIISNGCHWIDHFLYLNDYSPYSWFDVRRVGHEDLALMIGLENGASAVITLSDVGSNRIGVREFVELSVPGRRCTITDSMYYVSESNSSVIRKSRTDKLHSLRVMYDTIGQRIVGGHQGDSAESLLSTELTIRMDMQLRDEGVLAVNRT